MIYVLTTHSHIYSDIIVTLIFMRHICSYIPAQIHSCIVHAGAARGGSIHNCGVSVSIYYNYIHNCSEYNYIHDCILHAAAVRAGKWGSVKYNIMNTVNIRT